MMLSALTILAVTAVMPPSDTVKDALGAGDAHYARRAEGARGGTADPAQVDAAIAEYRKALALDADSLDARVRLMRAYYFRGGFCGLDRESEMRVDDEGKALAEDTLRRLDAVMGRVRGRVSPESAARVPLAADVYLWSAVSWGQWAAIHRVAAAWQGAPGRIRDLCEAVLALAPQSDLGAAAHLILGRLHNEAPRIPMVTMWVSRTKGLSSLRAGLTIAPDSPPNIYFLAEALLARGAAQQDEARELLERCATLAARPQQQVEDLHYARKAQERLAGLAARRAAAGSALVGSARSQ